MNGAIGRFLARWKRTLLIASGIAGSLLLLVLLVAPGFIASTLHDRIAATLRDTLRGGGDVGRVSFSWPCSVSIADVVIRDEQGAEAVTIPRASAQVSVSSLFGGAPSVHVEADGARIVLAQDGDGRVNLMRLRKPDPPAEPAPGPATAGPPAAHTPPSPFHAEVLLTDARIACRGHDSAPAEFRVPRLRLAIDRGGGGFVVDADRCAFESDAGRAEAATHLDLRNRADGTSTLNLSLDRIGVSLWVCSWIRYVHPLFAMADLAGRRSLEGTLTARLDLAYRGSLSAAMLAGGWEALPKAPVSGSVHVEGSGLGLRDTPALAGLRDWLKRDIAKDIELHPFDVTLKEGRVHYDHALRMNLAGEPTTWTGSLGLDQSLDLTWNVPVGDGLAKQAVALAALKGTTLRIPVKGTLSQPDVQWKGAVAGAGRDQLFGLVGGKTEKEAGALLDEADALYEGGKKKEAAALYRRIASEFKRTIVYKTNKDRIKQREAE